MRITVRIPAEPRFAARTLRFIVESFSYMYGGSTITEARGTWLDNNCEMVYNRVWVVEAYENYNKDIGIVGWEVYELAEEAKTILGEDTIMYTINDNAYFS